MTVEELAQEVARAVVRQGTRDELALIEWLERRLIGGVYATPEKARAALVVAKALDWVRLVPDGRLGLGNAWLSRFAGGDINEVLSASARAKVIGRMRIDAGLTG